MNIKLNDREINAIAEAITAFETLNIDNPSSGMPDKMDVLTLKTLNGVWQQIITRKRGHGPTKRKKKQMQNIIEANGTALVVVENATVDEYVSMTSMKHDDNTVSIRVSRHFLEKSDNPFAEPVRAEGFELLNQYASINVSPEHARAFAMAILDSISEWRLATNHGRGEING